MPGWQRCEDEEGEYWWHPAEGVQRTMPDDVQKAQAAQAAKDAAEKAAEATAAEQRRWELMVREAAYREPGEDDVYWWNETTGESQRAAPAGLLRRDIAVLGEPRCAVAETAAAFAHTTSYHAGDARVERCECYVGRSGLNRVVIRPCTKLEEMDCEPLRSRSAAPETSLVPNYRNT